MKSIIPLWIVDIATVVSILGFFITLVVFWQVRFIKQSYGDKARLPEIRKEISAHTSNISRLIPDWENSMHKIHEEFSICIGLLDSLDKRLKGNSKQIIRSIRSGFMRKSNIFSRELMVNIPDKNVAWALYSELSRANTCLDQIIKDMNWK